MLNWMSVSIEAKRRFNCRGYFRQFLPVRTRCASHGGNDFWRVTITAPLLGAVSFSWMPVALLGLPRCQGAAPDPSHHAFAVYCHELWSL
jgi:hypothetical protein